VQSIRLLDGEIIKVVKSCGFTSSLVDPCLWVKQSNSGIVMIAIYVDNCSTIASHEGLKEVIEDLNNHDFGLKIEEYFKGYLR
jgi:hypothetical protein